MKVIVFELVIQQHDTPYLFYHDTSNILLRDYFLLPSGETMRQR